MKWKPIKDSPKLVIVNCTMLASFDNDKCKFCGRYGCTDRGFTVTAGEPPVTIGEALWGRQLMEKLNGIIENGKLNPYCRIVNLNDSRCVRKLKASNAMAVIDNLMTCNEDCRRNNDSCPYRNENFACQRNVDLDGTPLICMPEDDDYFDCEFHEKAFKNCYRRKDDNQCDDVMEKLGAVGVHDVVLMLSHRFSAAPCRFNVDGTCNNTDCLHHEGVCVLQWLMTTCEQYAPVDSDHNYTEGVCTFVGSLDGKDDRKIFNTSDYAYCLDDEQATTLCIACRISHNIAKATGLKCLGVRRSSKNPLLNDENPLADNAIQINYLYLTHPEDVAKYNPDLIAQAVYDAIYKNCKGIGCDEIDECNFIKR